MGFVHGKSLSLSLDTCLMVRACVSWTLSCDGPSAHFQCAKNSLGVQNRTKPPFNQPNLQQTDCQQKQPSRLPRLHFNFSRPYMLLDSLDVLLSMWAGGHLSVKLQCTETDKYCICVYKYWIAELSQSLMHLIVIVPSDLMFPLWSLTLIFFFSALTSFLYQRAENQTPCFCFLFPEVSS